MLATRNAQITVCKSSIAVNTETRSGFDLPLHLRSENPGFCLESVVQSESVKLTALLVQLEGAFSSNTLFSQPIHCPDSARAGNQTPLSITYWSRHSCIRNG